MEKASKTEARIHEKSMKNVMRMRTGSQEAENGGRRLEHGALHLENDTLEVSIRCCSGQYPEYRAAFSRIPGGTPHSNILIDICTR